VPLFSLLGEVDFLAWLQAHESTLGVVAAADVGARTLLLTFAVHGLHRFHFDFEQQFDGSLDFWLGRIGGNRNTICSFFSATMVAFSEITGATSTFIRRSSLNFNALMPASPQS
jgi:hypothetical protein